MALRAAFLNRIGFMNARVLASIYLLCGGIECLFTGSLMSRYRERASKRVSAHVLFYNLSVPRALIIVVSLCHALFSLLIPIRTFQILSHVHKLLERGSRSTHLRPKSFWPRLRRFGFTDVRSVSSDFDRFQSQQYRGWSKKKRVTQKHRAKTVPTGIKRDRSVTTISSFDRASMWSSSCQTTWQWACGSLKNKAKCIEE